MPNPERQARLRKRWRAAAQYKPPKTLAAPPSGNRGFGKGRSRPSIGKANRAHAKRKIAQDDA